MNEIKAQEYIRFLDNKIEWNRDVRYNLTALQAYEECKAKFLSLTEKPYDPDHDSAV